LEEGICCLADKKITKFEEIKEFLYGDDKGLIDSF
jgi:hypothetical protein